MTYSFRITDPDVESGLRRVALDQLDSALAELDGDDLDKGIHDARKRMKKLRGLIRLVRPAFADYAHENAELRDAARLFSATRERGAAIETLDRLVHRHGAALDRRRLAPLRRMLEAQLREAKADPDTADKTAAFRRALTGLRDRVADWRLDTDGTKAVAKGLAKTYARGRKAMSRAVEEGGAADYHEWRKRTKYHGYHVRLLRRAWPDMAAAHKHATSDLGDLLGDHHDLADFEPLVAEAHLAPETAADILYAVAAERARLEGKAILLGARVYAETPKALRARWSAWWTVWRAAPASNGQAASSPLSPASMSAIVSAIP